MVYVVAVHTRYADFLGQCGYGAGHNTALLLVAVAVDESVRCMLMMIDVMQTIMQLDCRSMRSG